MLTVIVGPDVRGLVVQGWPVDGCRRPGVVGTWVGPGQDPPVWVAGHGRVRVPADRAVDRPCGGVAHPRWFQQCERGDEPRVPMVVIPLASDQYYSAERSAALGLAASSVPTTARPPSSGQRCTPCL